MSINDYHRVLTSKGYAIKKSFLTESQIQQLRSDLTMSPKVLDKFQKMAPHFTIYYESKTRFYVPRHWGTQQFGEPEATIVSEGLPLSNTILFRTTFPPHDFQKEIGELISNRQSLVVASPRALDLYQGYLQADKTIRLEDWLLK